MAAHSLDQLGALLRSYRVPIGDERACQEAVERILRGAGIHFEPQRELRPDFGRIDLYLPEELTGIELKVQGSPTEVARQLHRYAESSEIDRLVLVTGRARLASIPRVLNNKEIRVVSLWEGMF